MSKVSAADVKKLREISGAGMMDCKNALVEAGGDFEKAIENLRKKGQKLSAKRAGREAKEGVVLALVSDDRKKGIIIRLSCETDFVSKNKDFIELTEGFAKAALTNFPANKEELLSIEYNGAVISEKVTEQVGVIGEKIELSAYERLEAEQVAAYIHMGNRAGVLVGLNKADSGFEQAGRDVAMQVAAMRPVALDKGDIDQTVIEKEIEIGKEQARRDGKPEAMLENIAKGKLSKFFKESTLLNQQFVKDGKKSVRDYLASFDSGLTVTGFKHVELGK